MCFRFNLKIGALYIIWKTSSNLTCILWNINFFTNQTSEYYSFWIFFNVILQAWREINSSICQCWQMLCNTVIPNLGKFEQLVQSEFFLSNNFTWSNFEIVNESWSYRCQIIFEFFCAIRLAILTSISTELFTESYNVISTHVERSFNFCSFFCCRIVISLILYDIQCCCGIYLDAPKSDIFCAWLQIH